MRESAAVLGLFLAASGLTAADPVLLWNEATLDAIRAERTPPPVAARNLAMVHVAVYDAFQAAQPTHAPFRFRAAPAPGASAEAAAAVAAHRILSALYPRRAAACDVALDRSLEAIPDGEGKAAGVALGQAVAEAVLDWRGRDGAGARVIYPTGVTPGLWRPTPPTFREALLPHWRAVAPFALTRPDQFRPPAQPGLDSPEYAADLREVKELGGTWSASRTADQTEIARFWADGEGTVTPPGHWNRIARSAVLARGTTAADNARLFALLNVALADAGVACWDGKFRYHLWRPVTAIRATDPAWESLLETPPFPSYPSGHSTFSGAAAAVLAAFFGTDAVAFDSASDALPGAVRHFAGFRAAAEEAGRSRIYGGIHYEFDNREGLACGRALGRFVAEHFFRPLSPEAR
jgi:hypothetical protein